MADNDRAIRNAVMAGISNATNGMKEQVSLACGFMDASTGTGTLFTADPMPNGGYKYEAVKVEDIAPAKIKEIDAGMISTGQPSFCVKR